MFNGGGRWIKRVVLDQHDCPKPGHKKDEYLWKGSQWQCDKCKTIWSVVNVYEYYYSWEKVR